MSISWTSVASINCTLKIFTKNSACIEYIDFFLAHNPLTIQHNNYLHSIYIVLGIISNLEMIQNIWARGWDVIQW
jgi:hypothetical protein